MVYPVLPKTPIPQISLSAAGLVALADLQTIARRTALTGTSSWFDALVLAPGLHYQQAAEEVVGSTGGGGGGGGGGAGDSGGFSTFGAGTGNFVGNGGGDGGGRGLFGTEALPTGGSRGVRVTNPGMLLFLYGLGAKDERAQRENELRRRKRRIGSGGGVEAFAAGARGVDGEGEGRVIILDVGTLGEKRRRGMGRGGIGGGGVRGGRPFADDAEWELERGSNLLYLASPLLTMAASIFMILLADWWGLAAILALITSRLLNIYIIKQRSPNPPSSSTSSSSPISYRYPSSSPSSPTKPDHQLSEYKIPLSNSLSVLIRGPAPDLAALTTDPWLLSKTAVQGYLEAAAKLAVYLVAVFSGNISQAGNIVLLVLLLASAALLGLSNGFLKGVRGQGGRVVARVRSSSSSGGGGGVSGWGRGWGRGSHVDSNINLPYATATTTTTTKAGRVSWSGNGRGSGSRRARDDDDVVIGGVFREGRGSRGFIRGPLPPPPPHSPPPPPPPVPLQRRTRQERRREAEEEQEESYYYEQEGSADGQDWASQAGTVVRDPYPFEASVDYT